MPKLLATPPPFDRLSDDLVLEVFRNLDGYALSRAAGTCVTFRNIEVAHSQELWQLAFRRLTSAPTSGFNTVRLKGWTATQTGGVHDRLEVPHKQRYIHYTRPLHRTVDAKTAKDLNLSFEFFVQLEGGTFAKPKVQTVKMTAIEGVDHQLCFDLIEPTSLEFEPDSFEVHVRRRADGALTQLFYGADVNDAFFEDGDMAMFVPGVESDVISHGDYYLRAFATIRNVLSEHEFTLGRHGWSGIFEANGGLLSLEPGEFSFGSLMWEHYSDGGGSREEPIDVTALYGILSGTAPETVSWIYT